MGNMFETFLYDYYSKVININNKFNWLKTFFQL